MKKNVNAKPVNPTTSSIAEQPITPYDPTPVPGSCPGSCNGCHCPGAGNCEAIARLHFVKFYSPFLF